MTYIGTIIPQFVKSGKNKTEYRVELEDEENRVVASYFTRVANKYGSNVGQRQRQTVFPKYIFQDGDFFTVMGLLQGEMSKTNHTKIAFSNTCPKLVNEVLEWFESQWGLKRTDWNWYVSINIPSQIDYADQQLEEKLTTHWITECGLSRNKRYPKGLHFRPKSKRREAKNDGVVTIEHRNPLFAQTIMELVARTTANVARQPNFEVQEYLRGIIAAEGCINYELKYKHRRVFITACSEWDRLAIKNCLDKLSIEFKDCKPIKDIIISRKENLEKLHELDLMSLHPKKHAKFLEMMSSYTDWWHEARATT